MMNIILLLKRIKKIMEILLYQGRFKSYTKEYNLKICIKKNLKLF